MYWSMAPNACRERLGDAKIAEAQTVPPCGSFLSRRAELFRALSGHHKVDLVERNASVPVKAAETTLSEMLKYQRRRERLGDAKVAEAQGSSISSVSNGEPGEL